MSGLIVFSDGRVGLVGDDGFIEEFDAIDTDAVVLEGPRTIGGAFIDVEPLEVLDSEADQ